MSIIRMDDQVRTGFKKPGGTPILIAAKPRGTYTCDRCHQPFEAGTYAAHVRASDHPNHDAPDVHTGRR